MSFKFSGFSSSGGGTPSNSNSGGGLYAGIALGGKKNPEDSPSASLQPGSENSSEQQATPAPVVADEETSTPKETGSKEHDKSKASTSSWSSSLRFAPVIRKTAAKPASSKPFAVPFSNLGASKSTSTAAAFAPEDDEETGSSNLPSRTIHIPGRAKAALTATPVMSGPSKAPSVFARKGGFLAAHAPERLVGVSNVSPVIPLGSTLPPKEKVDSGIPGLQHSLPAILAQTTTLRGLVPPTMTDLSSKPLKKKLDQPPPLTLPDEEFGNGGGGDVNGFAQSEAGRKLALRAARTSKKNKKKGKTREVDPAILFLEDYDPARPNDYNEWMNFCKRRREQRREAIRLEREHQRRKEREELTESSAYSSEEDGTGSDDAPPAKAMFFAPPANYNTPVPDSDQPLGPSMGASARGETGDEAYARRVALSQGIPFIPAPRVPEAEDSAVDNQMTTLPSDPSPEVIPSVSIAEAQARAKTIAERLQKLRNEAEQPSPPVVIGPSIPVPKPMATMEEAQAKARQIAAKLAALGGNATMPTPASETLAVMAQPPSGSSAEASQSVSESISKAPGQPDFARRLMDKYGWKEGQGLGASESGRTTILTVATAPSQSGKRKKNQPEIGPGPSAPTIGKGRGVVVDEAKAQRDQEEKARYGDPTRVVYLTNVVAVDEVDDELSNEIAEEAGKHGIVERCFVRIVQKPVDDPAEAVRVFIVFSGLVGAWKAVKTFDGRFFGGRTIRARFFSENKLTLGEWDS